MKTIEEKAKSYDDVLERVKTLYEKSNGISNGPIFKKWLEENFPELAESEDEKIKQDILRSLDRLISYYEKDESNDFAARDFMITMIKQQKIWIEKQKEQSTNKIPDRIHPKFSVGDIVCRQGWADHTIQEIYIQCEDPVYVCKNDEGLESHISMSEQDEWHKKNQKHINLQEEIDNEWNKCNPIDEGMGLETANIEYEQFNNIAEHFYNLGMKSNPKNKKQLENITPKFIVGDIIHEIGENIVYPLKIEQITDDGYYRCNNGDCFVSIEFQDDYEPININQIHIKRNCPQVKINDYDRGFNDGVSAEKFNHKNSIKWTAEDEKKLSQIETIIKGNGLVWCNRNDLVEWLKSLCEKFQEK